MSVTLAYLLFVDDPVPESDDEHEVSEVYPEHGPIFRVHGKVQPRDPVGGVPGRFEKTLRLRFGLLLGGLAQDKTAPSNTPTATQKDENIFA